MSTEQPHNKVVVIGLDGSSWDLVKPLVDQGKLPNIAKMIHQGVATTMYSTLPAHSAPAWTTFATGVTPIEHGCLDFLVVKDDLDNLELIDSTKIKQETIYELMVRHSRTPILINLPNTFPPKLKDNITITSLMTRGDKYIYPESLKQKYPELQKYRLSPNPKLRMTDNLKPYLDDLCLLEQERLAGVKQLFLHEPWDFFFYLCSGTDWVSHVAYDKALAGYEPAVRMWYIMDEFIGWVMQQLDKNTTLFVISDHGFKVYDKIFYINRWLETQGHLTTTEGQGSFHQAHTKLSREITKSEQQRKTIKLGKRIRHLFIQFPIIEKIAKWLYWHIVKRFLPVNIKMNLRLDLTNTTAAFPRGSMANLLYINDNRRFTQGIVPPEQRSTLVAELKDKLTALTDTQGQPIVGAIHSSTAGPDLLLESDRYYLSGSLDYSTLYDKKIKNYHDKYGMFMAYGNGIEHRDIAKTAILNMAPTIVQAMGLPQAPQFVGQPMDIFSPNTNSVQKELAQLDQLVADIKF